MSNITLPLSGSYPNIAKKVTSTIICAHMNRRGTREPSEWSSKSSNTATFAHWGATFPTMLLKAIKDSDKDGSRRWVVPSRPGQTNTELIGEMCLTSLSPLVRCKALLQPVKILNIDLRSAITCLLRDWVLQEAADMLMCCGSQGLFQISARGYRQKTGSLDARCP